MLGRIGGRAVAAGVIPAVKVRIKVIMMVMVVLAAEIAVVVVAAMIAMINT
jgi:hypothetical protein